MLLDRQTNGRNYTNFERNLAMMVIYLPVKFEFESTKHFYCVNTSYPMDNSLSGRRRPARQTSEKDVLCLHQQVGPEYQCTRQMACRTSFLSRQSDVIASFSFGANQCTVENLYLPEFVFYQCLL